LQGAQRPLKRAEARMPASRLPSFQSQTRTGTVAERFPLSLENLLNFSLERFLKKLLLRGKPAPFRRFRPA